MSYHRAYYEDRDEINPMVILALDLLIDLFEAKTKTNANEARNILIAGKSSQ